MCYLLCVHRYDLNLLSLGRFLLHRSAVLIDLQNTGEKVYQHNGLTHDETLTKMYRSLKESDKHYLILLQQQLMFHPRIRRHMVQNAL